MHKDFKIGLGVGLLLVVAAIVWLCTSPKLSTESRALQNTLSKPAPAVTVIPQPPVETKPANPEQFISSNVQPSARAEQNHRFYVVQSGDTLSGISRKFYGSQRHWPKILNANRDILHDPNRLTPGLRLIIPE